MQKTTISSNKADFKSQPISKNEEMLPSEETLKKILQFAACYRAQSIGCNQFVDMNLN